MKLFTGFEDLQRFCKNRAKITYQFCLIMLRRHERDAMKCIVKRLRKDTRESRGMMKRISFLVSRAVSRDSD